MADVIDDAQVHEAQYLAACLANARAQPPDEAQERDEQGRVICSECGELISLARLARLPTATKCTDCQDEAERGRRQFERA